jgi:hypothetical protein
VQRKQVGTPLQVQERVVAAVDDLAFTSQAHCQRFEALAAGGNVGGVRGAVEGWATAGVLNYPPRDDRPVGDNSHEDGCG